MSSWFRSKIGRRQARKKWFARHGSDVSPSDCHWLSFVDGHPSRTMADLPGIDVPPCAGVLLIDYLSIATSNVKYFRRTPYWPHRSRCFVGKEEDHQNPTESYTDSIVNRGCHP